VFAQGETSPVSDIEHKEKLSSGGDTGSGVPWWYWLD